LAQSLAHAGMQTRPPASGQIAAVPASDFRAYFERMRDQPVYVVLGVQGSGTNLLSRLLTKLFGFSVLRDRSAVFNAAAALGPQPTPTDIDREIRRFKRLVWPSPLRRKFSKYVILKRKPLEGLASELLPSAIDSGADFARLIYTYRAFSLGAAHVGIKSDDLWQTIHHIDQVLPNRRIILLTRDFRDNLVSISGKRFGPIEPLRAAQYVKRQLGYYAPEFRRAGAAGYHVTYEALLNDTRAVVDGFARHFNLQPILDLDTAIPALKFRPNKIGKWKKGLTERELAVCEGLLYDELLEFGYAPITPARVLPTAGELFAATARDTMKRVPQKFHRLKARVQG
jgi:hypothetical protein